MNFKSYMTSIKCISRVFKEINFPLSTFLICNIVTNDHFVIILIGQICLILLINPLFSAIFILNKTMFSDYENRALDRDKISIR